MKKNLTKIFQIREKSRHFMIGQGSLEDLKSHEILNLNLPHWWLLLKEFAPWWEQIISFNNNSQFSSDNFSTVKVKSIVGVGSLKGYGWQMWG